MPEQTFKPTTLSQFKKHNFENCSDENPINHGYFKCFRCTHLKLEQAAKAPRGK